MTRDDRFYAFIVARSSRSRSHIRRICVHERWLKASALALVVIAGGLIYGFYGLTQQAEHLRIESGGRSVASQTAVARDSLAFLIVLLLLILGAAALIAAIVAAVVYLKRHSSAERQITLSGFVQIIVSCVSPEQNIESILGDLQEECSSIFEDSGRLRAKIWLYRQLLTSTIPLVYTRVKSAIFSWSRTR